MSGSVEHACDALRIGELLRRSGCLTDEQLQEALAEQRGHAPTDPAAPVGEICASHGWCTSADVAAALHEQHAAIFRDTTLGHLLLAQGRLTLRQLEAALDAQAELNAPLGQVLVSEGFCSPEDVHGAVDLQQQRRNSSLCNFAASRFHTWNVIEIVVNQELDDVLREEEACGCDECRANALALALNSLPPRYVSDQRQLLLFVERFRAESLELIRERTRLAVRRVQERPKSVQHTRGGRGAGCEPQAGHPLPVRRIERHAHLSQGDVEALFGPGHQLRRWKGVSQPGCFAARETIHVIGPKGTLERVRVIGPAAAASRVEVTGPDLFLLGRDEASPAPTVQATLWGPHGAVKKHDALVRIVDHIHVSPGEAEGLHLSPGEAVEVRIHGRRPCVLERVAVQIAEGFRLELHLPADEGASRNPRAELLLPLPCAAQS